MSENSQRLWYVTTITNSNHSNHQQSLQNVQQQAQLKVWHTVHRVVWPWNVLDAWLLVPITTSHCSKQTCNKRHKLTETTSSSTSSRCIKADAHLWLRLHQKSSSCCRDIVDKSSPRSNTSSVAVWTFNTNKQQRFSWQLRKLKLTPALIKLIFMIMTTMSVKGGHNLFDLYFAQSWRRRGWSARQDTGWRRHRVQLRSTEMCGS